MNLIRQDGFDFAFDSNKCQECEGRCCTGESGYIWVDKNEIINIANFLQIDTKIFIDNYLKKINYKYSLKELKINNNYECVFFDNKQKNCKIYTVRPKQCVSFPFWDYFKKYPEKAGEECPGIVY